MRNIVLTGMSGSGKTTLGRLMAARLGCRFVDTDLWIEEHCQKGVKEIFAGYGETFFRAVETDAVRRAAQQQNTVISTGGGVVLNPENMRMLRETGVVIFNDRPIEVIAEDIKLGHRPLLPDIDRLFALAEQRRPIYLQTADLVLSNRGTEAGALAVLLNMVRIVEGWEEAV